uniref:glutamate--tRNA ligase n=1 Tax=Physcomitrium patens TaxID=3218 RepID=A0A7I4CEY7_PHYPA
MAEVKQLLSLIIDTFKSSEGHALVGNPSEVDEWLSYASSFGVRSEFEGACAHANNYLSLRTYFVGNDLTVADITIVAYLAKAGPRWESFRKSAKFPNLVQWYNCILVQYPAIANVLPSRGAGKPAPEVSKSSSATAVSAEAKETVDGSFEVDLPGAEMGKVCTRFPPEPSGYLHIGHAEAVLLNQFFAQKYKGRLIIRFDDTNPAKEKDEFVESILQDLDTLWRCEKLIKEGKAYVSDTEREQMQLEREAMIESKYRNQTVEENLKLWKEMIAGSTRGVQCCVRAKMDMSNPNASLRDPVYYHCNPTPHHRVGSKYKVYPTYDFACPFVDSIEGVTHALRSSEYHDRNDQSPGRHATKEGSLEGRYDPRFPIVQGIIRRGLTIEALKQFILSQGASKNLNLMEWDKLWNINKKIIDPVCPRHTAVLSEGKVLLDPSNGPETPFTRVILRHKKYVPAGKKATVFTKKIWLDHADATAVSEGEEVTLMDWGNCFIRKIERDQYGLITRLQGEFHVEGSVKTTKLKLTWLPKTSELVPLTLVDLDHLIVKKKLEENDDFVSVLNPVTRIESAAVGDSNMRNLQRGEIIQLERKGYYICDVPFLRSSKPIVLISIPDGRQQKPPGQQR